MATPSSVRQRRNRRTISTINMVPFIDVMLVLLIIFMVTAPMLAPSLINLPQVGQADERPPEVVQIDIAKDESLSLKTAQSSVAVQALDIVKAVSAEQWAIVKRMRLDPDAEALALAAVPVVINADKRVRYEAVIRVMDSLQRAGMQRVGLSVTIEDAPT